MATATVSRELAWKTFERTLRGYFPGEANRGMRADLRRITLDGGSVRLFGRSIAFTAWGREAIADVAMAADAWQDIAFREDPDVFSEESR